MTTLTTIEQQILTEEIREKGCKICKKKLVLRDCTIVCSVGKKFPNCKGKKGGFDLE